MLLCQCSRESGSLTSSRQRNGSKVIMRGEKWLASSHLNLESLLLPASSDQEELVKDFLIMLLDVPSIWKLIIGLSHRA